MWIIRAKHEKEKMFDILGGISEDVTRFYVMFKITFTGTTKISILIGGI